MNYIRENSKNHIIKTIAIFVISHRLNFGLDFYVKLFIYPMKDTFY